jgi:hypothetical protein
MDKPHDYTLDWSSRVRARSANIKGGNTALQVIEQARSRALQALQAKKSAKLVTIVSQDLLEKVGPEALTHQMRMLAGEAMAEAVERHWKIGVRTSASPKIKGDPVFSSGTSFRLSLSAPQNNDSPMSDADLNSDRGISAATLKRLLGTLTSNELDLVIALANVEQQSRAASAAS